MGIAKIQIMLDTFWKPNDAKFHQADNEDSNQTAHMPGGTFRRDSIYLFIISVYLLIIQIWLTGILFVSLCYLYALCKYVSNVM